MNSLVLVLPPLINIRSVNGVKSPASASYSSHAVFYRKLHYAIPTTDLHLQNSVFNFKTLFTVRTAHLKIIVIAVAGVSGNGT